MDPKKNPSVIPLDRQRSVAKSLDIFYIGTESFLAYTSDTNNNWVCTGTGTDNNAYNTYPVRCVVP